MTVAFPQLGAFGRFGNQLFQIAATIHHALEHDTDPLFPTWERHYLFPRLPERWFRRQIAFAGDPHVAPWNYEPLPYWEDMALHGYFQSFKFFDRRGGELDLLRPRSLRSFSGRHVCSVHVRRCDYLQLQDYHPSIPLEWYERAMEKAIANGAHHFRIMSDDPAWCAEQPLFRKHEISRDTEIIDLGRAAECEHHIIANSSFSWWAAMLSGGGSVIMPSPWFGPKLADHDETQLQVPGWEVLPWSS